MWRWFSRCVPGFTILVLLTLLIAAFPDITQWSSNIPWPGKVKAPASDHGPKTGPLPLTTAQKIFIGYSVALHLNAVTFVLRLAWALRRVCQETRAVLRRRPATKSFAGPADLLTPFADNSPMSTPDASPMVHALNPDLGSLEEGEGGEVVHAIILPNYCEGMDTLETTLKVLASHPRAATQYEIFLAMEQKEAKAPEKAVSLISTFESQFRDICSTFHPAGLPGEIAGKSSNVAFAAHHIVEAHRSDETGDSRDIIITVMDADTHLSQDYFTEIRRLHWRHNADADRQYYCSPIIFDRNSNNVPTLVRCADLLWGFAGMSAMYPGCPIVIPTSVYSLPLVLAEKVGGWDGDPTAIGEDMHMLLKCYFETGGDIITHVIHSPASQCNIEAGEGEGWRRAVATGFARYRQALRHMWGALDTGFAVRKCLGGLSAKGQPRLRLRPRHIMLFHLLFEAHFLPSHLTIIMLFSVLYPLNTPAALIHPSLAWTFSFTDALRAVSFIGLNICLAIYEGWHAVCVTSRSRDMARAGLHDTGFSFRKWWHWSHLLERVTFPIAGTIFGVIPAVHAEMSHFWTDRLVYRVSKKPTFTTSDSSRVLPA